MSELSYLRLKDRLTLQAEEKGIPLSGGFELTARCNFRCGMCYVRRPMNDSFAIKHELSAEQWIDLARQARDAGMLYVLLTGGDVFVRQDIQQIYENIFDLGLITNIYTNGSLITTDIINWLKKRPPQEINITLYGASSGMYERLCAVKNSYEKVVKNLDCLLDAGLNVGVSTTIIEKNLNEYEALLKISEDRGLALKMCGYISPIKRDTGKKIAESRVGAEKLVKYTTRFNEEFKKRHNGSLYSPEKKSEERANNLPCNDLNKINKSSFSCLVGKCITWLNWRGEMTGCSLMNDLSTYPLEHGFIKAWSILKELISEVPGCDDCSSCEYKENCMSCPVRLKNETGDYRSPAKYLCEIAKYSHMVERGGNENC